MDNLDKTTRSIFVGNIPYEATEEKLMALFSQAGPVIGFRLVYDRESGKPKGYGFCEYNSPAVAASALRNLDNIDYNGRPLRIGPAAGEQNSAEVAMTNNTTMKPPQESPYGDKVDPQQSGLAISQAVASLPPEQLFDLMQQMKQCIQSNPNEARQLLLQNPQLAYALLQAQIIMKIVEPKVAIAMLTRSNEQIPQTVIENQQQNHNIGGTQQIFQQSVQHYPPNVPIDHQSGQPGPGNMFQKCQAMQMPLPPQIHMGTANSYQQQIPFQPFPAGPPIGQNFLGVVPMFPSGSSGHQMTPVMDNITNSNMRMDNMKLSQDINNTNNASSNAVSTKQQQETVATEMMNYLGRTGEKEKAALIMQVLSLSDEEVAKLPDDQRRSIEVLKSQLKKN